MLQFSVISSPSSDLLPSLEGSPNVEVGAPDNSVLSRSIYRNSELEHRRCRDDNTRLRHVRLNVSFNVWLVCISANGTDRLLVEDDVGALVLFQNNAGNKNLHYLAPSAPGRRNTAVDGKKTTTAQASLRASHSSDNPIRVGKSNTQRHAQRMQPYPSTSLAAKTISPELCSKSKSYSIEIVQHPAKAAECGDATLTRLPLAPPLIARLVVSGDSDAGVVEDPDLAFLVAQVSLDSGREPISPETSGHAGSSDTARLLYGSLVSSPHILRNLQGRQGVYFLFPDVSVRIRGRYQLCVTLLRLPRPDLPEFMGGHRAGAALAQARSLRFDVLPREDYTAPAQTPLTQYFLQQGARMYAFASPPSSSYRG
ncbi:hypothetical protein DAEQUDRAFT_101592 [Daedalea quercina L-15889]|uniref:Velvet domain-containing protein n=1 Tax=Daedalea quercina L-15889 TaxID=1314783 RepID=A0A165KVL4_9APHY|nr:hypothetical protein DAEQUDRAFT_101592 [Daedalea quercina L-15889]